MNSVLCNIIYANGMVQEKYLVSHTEWLEKYKTPMLKADELDRKATEILKSNKKEADSLQKEAEKIRKMAKSILPETYFTDKSPMGLAMNTGIMILPESQGGQHKIKIILKEN